MRRRLWGVCLLALALCCAWAAGCRRAVPVDEVLAEVDAFTDELVGKVTTAPDPARGVEEAQKLLDARRAELSSKIAAVKRADEYRTDDAVRKKVMVSEVDNGTKVSGLQTRFISRSMSDAEFKAKLDKLVDDYQLMFKV